MASRGPDGSGAWTSTAGDAALGHRRLAIIDLSDAGAQPMSCGDGRYHIAHNGEIYNYRELREALATEGAVFRSSSDTEVLLALYERHGVEMLSRLRGMYAFAIWDSQLHRLFLARDPYGIKPLYYAWDGSTFRFASQVKALEASGVVSEEVDPAGLVGFLIWGSVPEPLTIRRAIRALPAGNYLTVGDGCVSEPVAFASLQVDPVSTSPSVLSPGAAIEESVRYHLVSDVPVGAFLSSGLDSAVVASLASSHLGESLTTLTLRFGPYVGTSLDEGPLAAEVAKTLGTRHVEHMVDRKEFLHLWRDGLSAMDQPSIDGFNSFVVSSIAHQKGLKVVLSGLGGDELLGGYPSFRDVPRWARWARPLARAPWNGTALGRLSKILIRRPKASGILRYGGSLPGAYLLRRGLYLPEELPDLIGPELAAKGLAAYDPVLEVTASLEQNSVAGSADLSSWIAVHLMESKHYMRNQLLRDSDWASMAHSLELRVPFVDATLQGHFATADFEPARTRGKASLLRSVAPELPAALWKRPKSGFSIPVIDFLDNRDSTVLQPSFGNDSRRLASRVLEDFGISLRPTRVDPI